MARRVPHSFSTTDEMWEAVSGEAQRRGMSQSHVINEALSQFFASRIQRSSWATQEDAGWYDAKKFYVYSQDHKGHSAQVRMYIPKYIAGEIAQIVSSGDIPELRSPQDFYRDAVFHRAHQLTEWLDNGELRKGVSLYALQAEEDRIREEKESFIQVLESTRQNMKEALERQDFTYMEEHLKGRWDHLSSVPERFRSEYQAMLEECQEQLKTARKGRLRAVRSDRREEA